MTGRTRKYLSDLANQKGVRFENGVDREQAWASEQIDRLKTMPDAKFDELTDAQRRQITTRIEATITEMNKWTFTR